MGEEGSAGEAKAIYFYIRISPLRFMFFVYDFIIILVVKPKWHLHNISLLYCAPSSYCPLLLLIPYQSHHSTRVHSILLILSSQNNIFMSRQPNINAAKNILGMNPYYDQFFAQALSNLRRVLGSVETVDNIEVEIKYAEFKYFAARFDEREWRGLSQAEIQRLQAVATVQSEQYLRGLQMLSKQSIINLTPLGRNTYQLAAGFRQQLHRKFYRIRDFLLKMCEHNERNNYQPQPLGRQEDPVSIYHELSLNNGNHLLRLREKNELRFDIYVKEGVEEAIRGRYSYSDRTGWSRTEKEPLCQQLDFMLNERTFRFAINREKEGEVDNEDLEKISRLLRDNPKLTDIRLKRLMRVTKGDILEYSLSEIYNINQINGNNSPEFTLKMISPPAELNAFLRKLFINFYSLRQQAHIKFEIQAEFTKEKTQQLKKLLGRERLPDVKHELDSAIEELYALYFCDHATKVKQVPWLNARVRELPETRLQNEFGSYMRQELYEAMRKAY